MQETEEEKTKRANACVDKVLSVFAEFDCEPIFEVRLVSNGSPSWVLRADTRVNSDPHTAPAEGEAK